MSIGTRDIVIVNKIKLNFRIKKKLCCTKKLLKCSELICLVQYD